MIYIHYTTKKCSIRLAVDVPMLTALSQVVVIVLNVMLNYLRQ